jgi:hypothetical protein
MALMGALAIIVVLMALRFTLLTGEKAQREIKSYQRLDYVLKDQQPILYRSLLSVVDEVADLREQEGGWPAVELLEKESIPPFAKVFLPVSLKAYDWSRHGGESWVDYFGKYTVPEDQVNSRHEVLTFLLRIIDLHTDEHPHPHQGVDYDKNLRYAGQVWIYKGYRPYTGKSLPEAGWKWIISPSDPSLGEDLLISETPGSMGLKEAGGEQ